MITAYTSITRFKLTKELTLYIWGLGIQAVVGPAIYPPRRIFILFYNTLKSACRHRIFKQIGLCSTERGTSVSGILHDIRHSMEV